MGTSRLRWALGLLGLACFPACGGDGGSKVVGAPGDVKTVPGSYDGYQVIDACQLSSLHYGVLGTGSSWYSNVAPPDQGRFQALWQLGNSVLQPAFADLRSISGIGVGTSCTQDGGVSILMSDWREVDRVLERSGRVLAERDLREEVSLRVVVFEPD